MIPAARVVSLRAVLTAIALAFALVIAAAFTVVTSTGTPAHAAPTCASGKICTWTGANFSGTETVWAVSQIGADCHNTTARSLIIGGDPGTEDASVYADPNCLVLGGTDLFVDVGNQNLDEPSFGIGTALSFSDLQVET